MKREENFKSINNWNNLIFFHSWFRLVVRGGAGKFIYSNTGARMSQADWDILLLNGIDFGGLMFSN